MKDKATAEVEHEVDVWFTAAENEWIRRAAAIRGISPEEFVKQAAVARLADHEYDE